jgi:hypothetical protein
MAGPLPRKYGEEHKAAGYGRWIFGVAGALIAAGLCIAPWCYRFEGLRAPAVAAGACVLATTVICVREHLRERYRVAAGLAVAGMAVIQLWMGLFVLPAFEAYKISKPLAAAVNENVPRGVPVAMYKYTEDTLIYYLDRGRPVEELGSETVRRWLTSPEPGALVVRDKYLQRLRDEMDLSRLREVARQRGFNYNGGKWMEVVVLLRGIPAEEPALPPAM